MQRLFALDAQLLSQGGAVNIGALYGVKVAADSGSGPLAVGHMSCSGLAMLQSGGASLTVDGLEGNASLISGGGDVKVCGCVGWRQLGLLVWQQWPGRRLVSSGGVPSSTWCKGVLRVQHHSQASNPAWYPDFSRACSARPVCMQQVHACNCILTLDCFRPRPLAQVHLHEQFGNVFVDSCGGAVEAWVSPAAPVSLQVAAGGGISLDPGLRVSEKPL